jgi:glycosyltransferase involved in cell wall biosynthesis
MGQRGAADDGALRSREIRAGSRRAVAFVVNGAESSAMGDRARAFAARLGDVWHPAIGYRESGRLHSVTAFTRWLARESPDVVYVLDMALAGVVASAWHRLRRRVPFVIDTGDAITALARSGGERGPLALAATAILERFSTRAADSLVVRGNYHRTLLAEKGIEATFIPDGVDLSQFAPVDGAPMRRALGLGDSLVVGLVGASIWSPALNLTYGWDLVEALALVRDFPVRGLLVGDGSGIERLRARADALGVADRLVLAGRRPLAELPSLLAACDVCLSTQTNDIPGNVRTTGKLPLYLASGRYVLASRVGEAARVLPDEMLVPYHGVVDREYPSRLAERIRELAAHRERLAAGLDGVALARQHFDYDRLAPRVERVLEDLLAGAHATAAAPVGRS